ncbi:unnamed protein product [Cuscuta epithymum]|uniref:C2 domain-containing protein n=1 Tax=Cuscuta epithymum TaxID=186058 RepID=A0AAV0CU19_9ASTE|nr:unnamed protein product [Cuscuta epithymum]
MDFRTLELKIMSAKDLKKVTFFSRMNVYVVVSVSGGDAKSNQTLRTPADREGGSNPAWNFPLKFTIDDAAARQNRLTLVFRIRCERALGDKDVGEIAVPIKELLDSPAGNTKQFVSYQVRRPSGKQRGQITFSYQFSEKISGVHAAAAGNNKVDEPVTAYPAFTPAVGPSSAYSAAPAAPPPNWQPAPGAYQQAPGGYPPPTYGYPPPPAYGGYPPQPHPGYGYPPVQQPARKNKFGLGLGAGLLGGALGGMLIGDAISDAANYDAGYDAGFGDGGFGDGGFDF